MTLDSEYCYDILLTCRLGMDKIVATYVMELDPEAQVVPSPFGYEGMVAIKTKSNKYELAKKIKERIVEVEKVFVVEACTRANIDDIVNAVKDIVRDKIRAEESFAVRTTRRGKHSFTSIDVNVAVGSIVKELTGASVNLDYPEKVVSIQILRDYAYISILPGTEFYKKMKPYKYPMYRIFQRFVVAHEPYLGPLDAAYTMGTRIGREVQTFEIGELVITPIDIVNAESLYHFMRGLFEGIESRYEIQKRSYGRPVHRVKVLLQDLYQFVRSRLNETIIVFEPEGEPISRVAHEVRKTIFEGLRRHGRINVLVGAREGIPTSIFRFADLVLDVAPGIVISTDYALCSALIALATVLHENLVAEDPLSK